MTRIVVGFAGPGGVCEGLRSIGLDAVGVEWDPAACATRTAAGHRTIRADATTFPLGHLADVDGLVMTPPCQAFSSAGKGDGRAELARLRAAIDRGDWTARTAGSEVLEVGRWAETLRPRWVVCEQVPPVLPLWEAYAARWRALHGWSCWAGTLLAADFGVPQTRLRAFLLARTDGRPARPPAATHCKGGADTLFGGLEPWVSMAEALGWHGEVHHWRGAGMAERHGDRPGRSTDEPAFTVECGSHRRMVVYRDPDEPAPTLCGHRQPRWLYPDGAHEEVVLRAGAQDNATVRTAGEPAPTVLGSWDNGDTRWQLNRRQQHNGTPVRPIGLDEPAPTLTGIADAKSQWVWERPATPVKLTVAEALILQSFRPDYPVQGTKTERFRQVGDAVPPLLAAHVIAALTGRAMRAAA